MNQWASLILIGFIGGLLGSTSFCQEPTRLSGVEVDMVHRVRVTLTTLPHKFDVKLPQLFAHVPAVIQLRIENKTEKTVFGLHVESSGTSPGKELEPDSLKAGGVFEQEFRIVPREPGGAQGTFHWDVTGRLTEGIGENALSIELQGKVLPTLRLSKSKLLIRDLEDSQLELLGSSHAEQIKDKSIHFKSNSPHIRMKQIDDFEDMKVIHFEQLGAPRG